MPISDPQALRLSRRYGARLALIQSRSARRLVVAWLSLNSFREADEEEFAQLANPILDVAQDTSQALTIGYYGNLVPDVRSVVKQVRVERVSLDGPFTVARKALDLGKSSTEASQTAARRFPSMVTDEVMRAQGELNVQVDSIGLVAGYRRIPSGSTCRYCVRTAAQRYFSERSARNVGHRNNGILTCDCRVEPIFGETDPGRTINSDFVAELKAAEASKGETSEYFDVDGGGITATDRPDASPDTGQ